MIRPCTDQDFKAIYQIINDAAQAYQGVMPEDRWYEPYMSETELATQISKELSSGVMKKKGS